MFSFHLDSHFCVFFNLWKMPHEIIPYLLWDSIQKKTAQNTYLYIVSLQTELRHPNHCYGWSVGLQIWKQTGPQEPFFQVLLPLWNINQVPEWITSNINGHLLLYYKELSSINGGCVTMTVQDLILVPQLETSSQLSSWSPRTGGLFSPDTGVRKTWSNTKSNHPALKCNEYTNIL